MYKIIFEFYGWQGAVHKLIKREEYPMLIPMIRVRYLRKHWRTFPNTKIRFEGHVMQKENTGFP